MFPKTEQYLLSNQILRATNSIVLNIAEANFLNKSHTSINEVVSCLDIALLDKYFTQDLHNKYLKSAEKLANQTAAFRRKLL